MMYVPNEETKSSIDWPMSAGGLCNDDVVKIALNTFQNFTCDKIEVLWDCFGFTASSYVI